MTYDNIILRVINKEQNAALLKTVPHVGYMDLAIIFCYCVPELDTKDSKATILISNVMMEDWGAKLEDLMAAAMENTPRILGLKIRGIFTTIASYLDDDHLTELAKEEDRCTPLYVATNNIATNGAAVILYKDMLRAFAAKMKSDLYVIPSSVHEMILAKVVEGCEISTNALKEMIWNVNRTELPKEDVLSGIGLMEKISY